MDTSALAKRYVHEPRSDEVDAFLSEQARLFMTTLTTVEMRSLLARRRRLREIDAVLEAQLFAAFLDDVRQGWLIEHELSHLMVQGAVNLIAQLPSVALRSLDATHLAAAQQLGSDVLVTADGPMRDAAVELGLGVVYFG